MDSQEKKNFPKKRNSETTFSSLGIFFSGIFGRGLLEIGGSVPGMCF